MFEHSRHEYTSHEVDIEVAPVGRPSVKEVCQVFAKNLVAAAIFFDLYEVLHMAVFGWDMLSKKEVACGYVSEVDAYYEKFETGKRGAIHSHAQAM